MDTVPPILAALVHPALFWGGAGAVAAPILIHLLARRRFRRVRWAAIDFLLQAERQNRRRVLLEELLLLLLRCLAVALIALFIARPYLQSTGWGALLGGQQRTERIFLLDDSYSMGYTAEGASWFDRAKSQLVALIRWVADKSPGDPVTVLKSSQPNSPLLSGALLDDTTLETLIARIQALEPSQQTLNLEASIQSVGDLLKDDPGVVTATLFVISDFQRADWIEQSGRSTTSSASPVAPLTEWAGQDRAFHLVLLGVGAPNADNRCLADLQTGSGPLVAGIGGQLEAVIANHSQADVSKLSLQISIGPGLIESAGLDALAAGQTAKVPLNVTFPTSGSESVRVELPPDGLAVDDRRTVAVHVAEALRILVVNGEPSSDTYDDEVALLTTALRPQGAVFSGNAVTVIEEVALAETDLNAIHLVVLANVYRIDDRATERLEAFVRDGGGLLIFLGDQVDALSYNDSLFAEGQGLLPARLGEAVTPPEQKVSLTEGDFLHPLVSVFSGRDNPFVKRITFSRFFATEIPQEAAPAADGAKAKHGPHLTTVVARLNDPAHSPLIVERRFGKGTVTLVTSSCDLEWNEWAKDPSYVVAMLEAARHLARRDKRSTGVAVGEPLEIALAPDMHEADAILRTPRYPTEREIPLTAEPSADGQGLVLRWERTDVAGLYRILLRRRDGGQDVRLFAVNPDPRESDLSTTDEPALRRAMPQTPFVYLTSAQSLEDVDQSGRKELWRAFLIAVIGILVLEQALAFAFGRRGR
ncbi:MAG: BatA domain-containing protein [Phycisphaerae bacterium]